MAPGRPSLAQVVVKTVVTHTVTYFLVGLAAFWCLDYTRTFAEPGVRSLMRQTDDPLVMAGPLFQPHVVVDGKLVTGQNPASSEEAARAVLALLA